VGSDAVAGHAYVFAIVEDEPDMQLLISMMLRRDGRLDLLGQAASAVEALEMLDHPEVRAKFEHAPGVIILDHGIDGELMGLEAAPLLKAKVPTAKIVLFTAFDMSREAAAEPSVDAFLRKDRITDLLPTVQSLLGLDARREARG
jgi:CheY-like chemotaxis protein